MSEKEQTKPFFLIKGWKKRMLLFFLALYFFIVPVSSMLGEYYMKITKKESLTGDYEKVVDNLVLASYFGYLDSRKQETLASFLSGLYFEKGIKNEKLLNLAEQKYKYALLLNKTDGDLYIKIAEYYFNRGDLIKAEQYLIELMKKFPYNQSYKLKSSEFFRAINKNDKAIIILKEIDAFFKVYAPLNYLRSSVFIELAKNYNAMGDVESYIKYKEMAKRFRNYLKTQAGGNISDKALEK